MTIPNVSTNDPVLASTHKQIIDYVNSSPNLAFLGANGLWSVPSGVHKFKVSLVGGGGYGGSPYTGGFGGESVTEERGFAGMNGNRALAYYSGVAIGTTFACTVGAGGNASNPRGGATSFGVSFSCPGGYGGDQQREEGLVNLQPATFPPGAAQIYGGTQLYIIVGGILVPYGTGGKGGYSGTFQTEGLPGCIIIEW